LVVVLLQTLGVGAEDQQGYLVVGRLQVPWTRDCAGLNVLTLLWAVTLWVNRREQHASRYLLRLVLAVPVAFAANVGRILTLIGYRHLLFPNVESPQLHYFMGFLWLLPFVGLFVPRQGRDRGTYWLETLYLVASLSLLAPVVASPGGSVVALCAVVWLAQSRLVSAHPRTRLPWIIAWCAAAALIALASMESLWIPWLFLCPSFVSRKLLTSFYSPVLLLGTVPVLAMQTWAQLIIMTAAGLHGWRMWHSYGQLGSDDGETISSPSNLKPVSQLSLALGIIAPFVLNSLGGLHRAEQRPPLGVMAREIDANSYHVRLLGQPPDIDLTWYGPYGEGRHHTLKVCMRYRGVFLQPSGGPPSVLSDSQRWMREFFLQGGDLLLSYPQYLRRTFSPFSKSGIHIIATAPKESMTAESFAEVSEKLASQLNELR
jgi:exosortase/archaeosortase family protein